MNILECDGIVLDFGLRRILNSIYVKCQTGEVVGLLGRNGSGKSCLMKTIFGTQNVESKSVRLNGGHVNSPFLKNTVAYLPQHHFIPTFLKIKDAFKVYGVSTQVMLEYFEEFSDYLTKKPREITGGVLRIMEIFLVTGLPANFMLLDEPFSGIMPVHIEQLKVCLSQLKKNKGIVMTDHLYRHVTELADRVYVLANGKTYTITDANQLVQYGYVSVL
jgi:ABC-type multidrug transport system ATPase subunit